MKRTSRLGPAPKVKLVFAVALGSRNYHDPVHRLLEAEFGPIEAVGPIYRFSDFSPYYDEELGGETWKYLLTITRLTDADSIVPVKLMTEKWQEDFGSGFPGDGRRTVNIDPGYVNGWQFVLATVKNQGHRIYLAKGVFCEVTLLFRKGKFESLPWTYPDYQVPQTQDFLRQARTNYLLQASTIGNPREPDYDSGSLTA